MTSVIPSGKEVVEMIDSLEREHPIGDKSGTGRVFLSDYSYIIGLFPDEIRSAIWKRLNEGGVHEASALRRVIMAKQREHSTVKAYLGTIDDVLKIDTFSKKQRFLSPVETAQSSILELSESLHLSTMDSSSITDYHYRLIVAAHFLKRIDDVDQRNFDTPHEFHMCLELIRDNYHAMMGNLERVMNHDYRLVFTSSIAPLAVALANHPEVSTERIMRIINERSHVSLGLIDSILQGDSLPLDSGVL